MIRRSAFDQVGGFDEGFFLYWEDADLCRRLLNGRLSHVLHPDGRSGVMRDRCKPSCGPRRHRGVSQKRVPLLLETWRAGRARVRASRRRSYGAG